MSRPLVSWLPVGSLAGIFRAGTPGCRLFFYGRLAKRPGRILSMAALAALAALPSVVLLPMPVVADTSWRVVLATSRADILSAFAFPVPCAALQAVRNARMPAVAGPVGALSPGG